MTGIKDNKLISRPTQIINQEDEETEIAVPKRSEVKNKNFDLEAIIKRRVASHLRGMSPLASVLAYPFAKTGPKVELKEQCVYWCIRAHKVLIFTEMVQFHYIQEGLRQAQKNKIIKAV